MQNQGRHSLSKTCPNYGFCPPRVASQPILGKTMSAKEAIEMKWRLIVTFHASGVQGLLIKINGRLVPLSLKSITTNHRFLFIYLEDRPVYSRAPLHVVAINDRTQCDENPDLLSRDLAQLPKQRFPDPELPKCFLHVEVLELRTWSDKGSSRHPARPHRHISLACPSTSRS